jgi:hypothetical protein
MLEMLDATLIFLLAATVLFLNAFAHKLSTLDDFLSFQNYIPESFLIVTLNRLFVGGYHIVNVEILRLNSHDSLVKILCLTCTLLVQAHLYVVKTFCYVVIRIFSFKFQVRVNTQAAEVAIRIVFTVSTTRWWTMPVSAWGPQVFP